MDMVASFADNVGVPVPALIPLALVAVAALVFVLDGLSHVVLKPFKSPPVIATLPVCLLYTSPSPRDATLSRMPSSA